MTVVPRIAHGALQLALHQLHEGKGSRLLLLHDLGGSSAGWGAEVGGWPGDVYALDLAGHGASDWRPGGAYTPELFAADVDAALAATQGTEAYLAGAGLGAYVVLLVAGARPDVVRGVLLMPGPGLEGVGPQPYHAGALDASPLGPTAAPCDPVLWACRDDPRPPDYARSFALEARNLLLLEDGGARPPWWEALRGVGSARQIGGDRRVAFSALASLARAGGSWPRRSPG
jgi:pimeloyl-ACP methyl ester carboxylesterase